MQKAMRGLAAFLAILLLMTNAPGLQPAAWADFDSEYAAAGCNGSTTQSQIPEQKKQYCDAAKASQKGADTDGILWKIWALVAGVCVSACATEYTVVGASGSTICTGGSLAAGVTDAVMTKNYASALTSMTMTGMTYMFSMGDEGAKAGADAGKTGTKEGMSKKRMGACMNAVIAAGQAVMKKMSQSSAEKAAKSNLANARNLTGTAPGTAVAELPSYSSTGTGAGTGATTSVVSAPVAAASPATTAGTGLCASASSTGGLGPAISCAVSVDNNLPGFVTSSNFLKEVQDQSGMNPQDLYGNMSDPEQGIQAATGKALNAEQMGHLTAALADIKKNTTYDGGQDMMYAAAGGGGGPAKGGGDDSMGAMLAQIMSQFGPKPGEKAPAGFSTVDFKSLTRPQQQVVEDKSLSLFTRVSFRYYYAGRIMLGGDGK